YSPRRACGKSPSVRQHRAPSRTDRHGGREMRVSANQEMDPAAMTEHAVLIVGAGPTGLMLAGELKLARGDVAIVGRRATQDLVGTRALGLHSRTLEVFDQRGIADRFLAQGKVAQVNGFAGVHLDLGDQPTRHPYGLALSQSHIERILAAWVEELGV